MIISDILTAHMQHENPLVRRQLRFIITFSLVGIASLLAFGSIHIYQQTSVIGGIELIVAGVGMLNLYFLYKTQHYRISSRIILGAMYIVLVSLLVSGGIADTGLFWFFTFPTLALFLAGKREGIRWILLSLLTIAVVAGLQAGDVITTPFSLIALRQLAFAYTAIGLLVFFSLTIHEDATTSIATWSEKLAATNEQLKANVHEQMTVEQQLQKSLTEIEGSNRELERSRQAMLNVLEDLDEEKANIEAILSSIGDGVFVLDAHGVVTIFNPTAERLSGYSKHEIVGKHYGRLLQFQDEVSGTTISLNHPSAKLDKKLETAITLKQKNGSTLPVAYSLSPLQTTHAASRGTVVAFHDMSEERALQKSKDEFVSLVSHQLRTPLSAINWYSELLLGGDVGPLKKDQRGYIEEIYDGNKRMIELINALLNVSRLALGKLISTPEVVEVSSVIDSLEKELSSQVTAKHIHYSTHVAAGVEKLTTDPKLLRIIIQNLLSNAIKYTPNKGSVSLHMVGCDKSGQPSKATKPHSALLTVTDTGYGIPKNQQSNIFSKLFRAENVQKLDVEGTGLGLYIVKEVAEKLGGKVWFESTENKGTTFYVVLPLHQPVAS